MPVRNLGIHKNIRKPMLLLCRRNSMVAGATKKNITEDLLASIKFCFGNIKSSGCIGYQSSSSDRVVSALV